MTLPAATPDKCQEKNTILPGKYHMLSILKNTKVLVSVVEADEDNLEAIPSVSARTVYPPGHFACPIVFYHWFYVHPRLHSEQFRGKGFSLGS